MRSNVPTKSGKRVSRTHSLQKRRLSREKVVSCFHLKCGVLHILLLFLLPLLLLLLLCLLMVKFWKYDKKISIRTPSRDSQSGH